MKCQECQFQNRESAQYCRECGSKLMVVCPKCGTAHTYRSKFCDECGNRLAEVAEKEKIVHEHESERKYVTALFSDLSGYTVISERLDPEELKEIMSRIFGEIAQVVTKYEGFIEKFVGDAVMALFGVPKAHEDDPIRAIKVAREIHELVDALSPEVEKRIGQPISMHTGINTGLVVTGKVDVGKGTHGVAGDSTNLASRLSSLAKDGEILVGPDTYRQAEGHFKFESLEPTTVKGKAESIQVHKVLSAKERPVTIHRLSGLRADLVGRKVEMTRLREAVENLKKGRGSIFSVCGYAGTGKSRLVEEFKAALDLKEIQWLEGRAYSYSQNIPYFPLIDLLNVVLEIEEGDPPEKVRERVESGIEDLVGMKDDIVPYIGSLYALGYPELENISPEFWKSRLQHGMQSILSALAKKAPTVFCLEDLHWADPSFLELLRAALLEIRQPAIVLCVYRPEFNLFTSYQFSAISKIYQEIRLKDLSPSEAQTMLESLLKTETIPSDLRRFVQDKAEGNPFYLEESVNSLIESEILIRDDGGWNVTRPISESDISSTIHGVISGRLDRLEKETKRILQEASVIGRAFLYKILKRLTELKQDIDKRLRNLERLDLIRTKSLQPDLEYMFKHALTQDVAYNSLLKKEREKIHERAALVMEQLFHDRLPEFYETLAFHYARGQSLLKAVNYLMKSAEKSWARYSLEESHQYFHEAYNISSIITAKRKAEQNLLVDLLIKWALVYHTRGDFKGLANLLSAHEDLARTIGKEEKLGMYYGWLGFALKQREKLEDGHRYLCEALRLGEEIGNPKVIGYSCAWLAWTCADLGKLDEALIFGKRAQEICKLFDTDRILFRFAISGLGMTYHFRGDCKKVDKIGRIYLDHGQSQSDVRSTFMGHFYVGVSHFIGGDFPSAIKCFQEAIQVSVQPVFSYGAKAMLGMSYLSTGQLRKAENTLEEVTRFAENFGFETAGTLAHLLLSLSRLAKGNLRQGLKAIEDCLGVFLENKSRWRYATGQYMLGKFYSQLAQRAGPKSLSLVARNLGFLIKNLPVASKKAENHLNKAIEIAREIGAKGVLGQAYLDLGLLHKGKGRIDRARECLSEAVRLFEKCEAEVFLKQAKKAFTSLE